jgi:DNA-binding LacI/PurR family transcriptional regulator
LLAPGELPTALLAFNDMIAFGVPRTLRMRGVRVPEDVSLIGYDDTELAGLSPVGLTSVGQDAARLAGIATRPALASAEGSASSDEGAQVVPPQLIVRATTGTPRDR